MPLGWRGWEKHTSTVRGCESRELILDTQQKKKATKESEKHAWNVARWIQAIYLTMCQHEKVIKIEDFLYS